MQTLQVTAITMVTALTLLFSPSLTQAQDWYDTDWSYRKAITIDADQVSASLTNFPLLVNTNDTHLLSNAESTGIDILFTEDDGTSLLDYEIESYSATTALVAWVRIPTLSDTTDTVIYLYYGNSSATSSLEDANGVWDTSNHVMVQHLNETGGDHLDSTSNGNDGTVSVTTQGSATGQINGADEFDGSPDIVDCGNATSLDITGSMTVEAWAYPNTSAASTRISSKDATGVTGKFILWVNSSGDLAFIVTDGTGPGGSDPWFRAKDLTNSITPDVWFHVVGVFDADAQEVRLYKDGVEVDSLAGPLALKSNTEKVTIGASDNNAQNWDGMLDEVRISDTARSAAWIAASHTNQDDPDLFYGIDTEETVCLLNTECGVCEKCDAGICVMQVNEDLKEDCGLCEKCDAGSCTDQADTEDVKDECPDEDCVTGLCDGLGACGVETSGSTCGDTADTDCTAPDTCDGAGVCSDNHSPDTTPCEDGEFCTDGDTCDGAGTCQPGASDPCQAGEVCNETTDNCDLLEVCGNGTPEGTEECDDGNTDDGDCCSSTCTFEANGSTCDDGAYCTDGDTCDGAGTCQPGTGDPCQAGEVCNESTDNCDSVPACGNGTPEGTEECDDGNTDDGDCCSSTCTFEANGSTCDDGAYCTDGDSCDGAGNCQPGAGDPCTSPEVCDEGSDQCVTTVPGEWWNTAWTYRKELTIDPANGDEDLINFPVLIDLTDADLRDNAQSSGEDIVFTDINGVKLSHEIELYTDISGHLIAWVNVPLLSSTEDTILYMYFGNSAVTTSQEDPAGTWDSSNHAMVQHLDETTGNHIDSTSNGNDGTPLVTMQGTALGQIDGADGFDGIDDNVNCGNAASLDITGSMTVEAWAFSAGGTTGPVRILSKDLTGEAGKFILWQNSAGELAYIVTDGIGNPPSPTDPWYRAVGSPVTEGEWFQVVGVFDADAEEVRLYKDGSEVAAVTGPAFLQSNTEAVTIGSSDDNDHFWNGTIDEVRISDVARSEGWIQTSYTNQNDPASFTEMGEVDTQCEGNFDCDLDCDGSDARLFKLDFGRSPASLNPCDSNSPCNGDFNCDGDVDGSDAQTFKLDFGRSTYQMPCSPCAVYDNCIYPQP